MTHTISIADALAQAGNQVFLVIRKPFTAVKGRFRVLTMPPIPFEVKRLNLGLRCQRALFTCLVRTWRPDFVYHRFSYDPMCAEVADKFGIPRICEFNGWMPHPSAYDRGDTPAWVMDLKRRQLLGAVGIIVPNEIDAERIVHTFGLPPGKVRFAPNGFDPKYVSPRSAQRNSDLTIVDVCGFQDYEDLVSLIKGVAIAHRRIASIKLVLAGKVPPTLDLAAFCIEAGLDRGKLVLPGQVARENLGVLLGSADVGCIALKKATVAGIGGCEATRLSEYWGAGLAVVATDLPGSRTYFHHTEGRLLAVTPEDPDSYAAAFTELGVNSYT